VVGALDPLLLDIMREAEASRVAPSILSTTYSTSFHSNRISDMADSIAKAQLGAMLDSGDPTAGPI
jgi:hypothetical protein